MDRTTIMLPHDLKTIASKMADTRGVSLGELIREALARMCTNYAAKKDPFFSDNTYFEGDVPAAIGKLHDNYLYENL